MNHTSKKICFKKLFFITFLLSACFSTNAQWSAVGTGTGGEIETLSVLNDTLYVGGVFSTAGGNTSRFIAAYDGTNWFDIGGASNVVYASTIYNNNLIIGGSFSTVGGNVTAYDVAEYNGSSWSSIGSPGNYVISLCEYNGELYAGGDFSGYISVWNGSSWSTVGSGLDGIPSSLCVYNGALYAGGQFYHAGSITTNYIAKWDGTSWDSVGSGMYNSAGAGVNAMASYNGSLYVGGDFTTAGGVNVNNVARWDGNNWSAVGSGLSGAFGSLAVYNSQLYASGAFGIANWDGTNWSNVCSGITGNFAGALAVFQGALYVGGYFTMAGGISVNNIAKYQGISITANDTVICADDSVQICATSGFVSYVWNNGLTSACITTQLAGNYYVNVTGSGNCVLTSNQIAILVNPLPPVTISINGDTLTEYGNELSYQWYINGYPIEGAAATAQSYIATQSGNYSLEITDSNGCQAFSTDVVISGIPDLDNYNISLFPNPASDNLLVQNNGIAITEINIYNATGSLVMGIHELPMHDTNIDISQLSTGVYIAEIKTQDTTIKKRWEKM